MKILNFKENKVENSIYELMKKCTVNNKLDENKFDDLINPREDGKIKINSAFMDQYNCEFAVRAQHGFRGSHSSYRGCETGADRRRGGLGQGVFCRPGGVREYGLCDRC